MNQTREGKKKKKKRNSRRERWKCNSIKVLFNPKYGLVFSFPGLDLSFPVALIKDLIMTDCSCEGFTKIVKAG